MRGPNLALAAIPQILGRQPTTVLEIGANVGTDTVRMLEAFPGATMHCFEPDPRAYAALTDRVSGTRARCYQQAVAATSGPLTFHQSSGERPGVDISIPGGWHASGSIHAPKVHLTEFPWCTFDTQITVDAISLDTWLQQEGVGTIDFIWADVQGAEHDLIEGGREALARTHLLYTEYCDRELYEGQVPLKRLLKMLPGWRLVRQYEWDVLLENVALRSARG